MTQFHISFKPPLGIDNYIILALVDTFLARQLCVIISVYVCGWS